MIATGVKVYYVIIYRLKNIIPYLYMYVENPYHIWRYARYIPYLGVSTPRYSFSYFRLQLLLRSQKAHKHC